MTDQESRVNVMQRNAAVRVLVSCEDDDKIGVDLLGKIDNLEVLVYDPNKGIPTEKRHAEILIPPYRSSHRPIPLLKQIAGLRMVQLLSAGADEWAGDVPADVLLSTARGAHAGPVSEWVLSAILCLYRQWPALGEFKREGIWAHRRVSAKTLNSSRVLIVGAGSIGSAVADQLKVFGARSTLVASTARPGIHAPAEIPSLLPDHDIVVITAPLTEQTRGLVDKDFLASMPDGALLVNAGRGKIVDTAALVAELQSKRLRAALDVTDPEPLPEDHPLWQCADVIISPHMARTVPGTNALCYAVAAEQVKAFLAGTTPPNAVRPQLATEND
ncbi:2-hydroxyacid dehydrogenase [Saccharopolyspora phatthalungensis]|uniref:Phosphoglycerate dehydrogenase-like enzyme n=1 Tax=Saccharopolyspora phatthalungensis TaxID=664693 RepID=A0A840PY00_9PSEU|nr:2-hydroxyacid dehydrogenase [Saccharopolyspora phatthalungensis]MBB5153186.1 phosphoglycerate dehydrogenase-like enzyme [Saccharopolyspora phatthalungensis]